MNSSISKKKDSLEEKEEEKKIPSFSRSLGAFLLETIKVIVISLLIIIPIRYFIMQPFYVRGASMEPNLADYEYLIIDEINYRFREPARGEIVVLKDPQNSAQFFIKRIIGLPNEKVKIQRGDVIITNHQYPEGIILEEIYLPKGSQTKGSQEVTLADNQFYVLGDNRSSSLDSRVLGPIEQERIIGKAWIRAWPLNKMTRFQAPQYFSAD